VGCFRQWRLQSSPACSVREQTIVARETWPAVTQTGAQVFVTNPRVGPDRVENRVNVSLGKFLGDHPKLVGETNLHRDVAVHRNLGQLRADDRHPCYAAFVPVVSSIELRERLARRRIAFADEDEVRLQQSVDDIPKRDELGIVADAKLGSAIPAHLLFEHWYQN